MKKYLLLTVFLLVSFYGFSTDNASMFDLNEQVLTEEFSELQTLENAVIADPTISLEEAVSMNLVTDSFSAEKKEKKAKEQEDFYFEWEGFLWGFLCCPVGFFVVAVNGSKSHGNKVSYWIGIGASLGLSLIMNSVVYY